MAGCYGIQIESHEDDSVTLRVGGLTARISAGSFKEANEAAWQLGKLVEGQTELRTLIRRVKNLAHDFSEVERLIRLADDNLQGLVDDLATEKRSGT